MVDPFIGSLLLMYLEVPWYPVCGERSTVHGNQNAKKRRDDVVHQHGALSCPRFDSSQTKSHPRRRCPISISSVYTALVLCVQNGVDV